MGHFKNYVARGKAVKAVSFVLSELSQTANIETKLTTCWYKGVNNLEMSSVSTISHEEILLPQCFSLNDMIKRARVVSAYAVFVLKSFTDRN